MPSKSTTSTTSGISNNPFMQIPLSEITFRRPIWKKSLPELLASVRIRDKPNPRTKNASAHDPPTHKQATGHPSVNSSEIRDHGLALPSYGPPETPQTTKMFPSQFNEYNPVTITLTTPDTSGASKDFLLQKLAANRTSDEHGNVRKGLILPPRILAGGRGKYEYSVVAEGTNKAEGGRARLRTVKVIGVPRTPRLVGMEMDEEGEQLEIGEGLVVTMPMAELQVEAYEDVEGDEADEGLDELCLF